MHRWGVAFGAGGRSGDRAGGSAAYVSERQRPDREGEEHHAAGGRSEAFFRDMHRLIHEGKIKRLPPKDPRSAIYGAMLIGEYPDEIRSVKPPNGVFKALAVVGRALRFKL